MSTKKFEQMAEYILDHLDMSEQGFILDVPKVRNNIGPLPLLKLDNKRILLFDKECTKDRYNAISALAKEYNLECADVFYKDGKTYFRCAAFGQKAGIKGIKYKQLNQLSLKDYTNEEVARMMLLSQPELMHLKKDNNILYYQPKSERLEEELRAYRFTPIRSNYNHIKEEIDYKGEKRYKPQNRNSTEVYINTLVEQLTEGLIFHNNTLKYKYQTLF